MKKLMIAAAIVCAAAFAQAGAVQWSALNVAASPATGTYKSDTTYTGYLFMGSDVAAVTALLSDAAKLDLEAFEKAAVATKVAGYTAAASKMNIAGGNYGNYGEGDTATGFMVIVDAATIADAKNFIVAETASGDQVLSQTFGKSGNKPFAWGDQIAAENTSWTKIAAVPEPTSGLLLLLGVAGLALKRRRA